VGIPKRQSEKLARGKRLRTIGRNDLGLED